MEESFSCIFSSKTSRMKKSIFVAGFAVMAMAASAQDTKKAPPKSPPPPMISKAKDAPPPPPQEAPPAPPEAPQPPDLPEDYQAFLHQNPTVTSLHWKAKNELVVRLRSGKEERYNLNDEKSRKAAEAKYGQLPTAPPPPPMIAPPPPPKAPKKKSISTT